jgi:hypothetical protein
MEVPVKISYQQGTITAFSVDPDYREMVKREAVLHTEPCQHNFLHISLGGTGALAPGEFRRIRYKFVPDLITELMQIYPKVMLPPRALFDNFKATAVGERLYPSSLTIDNVQILLEKYRQF